MKKVAFDLPKRRFLICQNGGFAAKKTSLGEGKAKLFSNSERCALPHENALFGTRLLPICGYYCREEPSANLGANLDAEIVNHRSFGASGFPACLLTP
jgi:hypothetical protein